MSVKVCCLIIALSGLLSSCIEAPPTPTPKPFHPHREVRHTENFSWQERWRMDMYSYLGDLSNTRSLTATSDGIAIMNGSTLTFIEASTGNLRWAVHCGSVDMLGNDEEKIYAVGDAGQKVEAYDLQTGQLVWKAQVNLPDHNGYDLQLQKEGLYVYQSSQAKTIHVFDKQTGVYVNTIPFWDIGGEYKAKLLQLNKEEWLQAKDKEVVFMRSGNIIWQTNVDGISRKFPWLYDNLFIVHIEDNIAFGLAALDQATGQLIWRRSGEFLSNFVIVDGLIYILSKKSDILVIDPKTGQTVGRAEIWPNTIDETHPFSGIAANEAMLYAYFYDSRELIAFERISQ